MNTPRVGILHYTAPPVTGGVEAVIQAHAQVMQAAGLPVTVIAGRGAVEALPTGVELALLPEMDSLHPRVLAINAALEASEVPAEFEPFSEALAAALRPVLAGLDVVMIHNVLTKHFNLPLTAALFRLLDEGALRGGIAWSHDLSWTSAHSLPRLHPGLPWNLLRTRPPGAALVTISEERRAQWAGLLGLPPEEIQVIPNGVDPCAWYGEAGGDIIREMGLLSAGLVLLLPVRVTQAKNIELAARVTAELKRRGARPRLVVTGPPDPHDPASLEYYQELLDMRVKLDIVDELRFVYEDAGEVDQEVVASLLHASDALFLPSHREGFGLPVLEAGLAGVPVVASRAVPAAREIGGADVALFDPGDTVETIADLVLRRASDSPAARLKRRVRQALTWEAIFEAHIAPLIASRAGSEKE